MSEETFTVWTIKAPPEQTVVVDRIVDLVTHISDLATCYLKLGGKVVITACELTQEEWDELSEFEGQ